MEHKQDFSETKVNSALADFIAGSSNILYNLSITLDELLIHRLIDIRTSSAQWI